MIALMKILIVLILIMTLTNGIVNEIFIDGIDGYKRRFKIMKGVLPAGESGQHDIWPSLTSGAPETISHHTPALPCIRE